MTDKINIFYDPGKLCDKELELVLTRKVPADPVKGYVPEYKFEMCLTDSRKTIGKINLRTYLTPILAKFGGHIGYEVDPEYRGNRYAARSCKLLFNLVKKHKINPILITCNTENIPSRHTCEIIGAKLIDVKEVKTDTGEIRAICFYHIEMKAQNYSF